MLSGNLWLKTTDWALRDLFLNLTSYMRHKPIPAAHMILTGRLNTSAIPAKGPMSKLHFFFSLAINITNTLIRRPTLISWSNSCFLRMNIVKFAMHEIHFFPMNSLFISLSLLGLALQQGRMGCDTLWRSVDSRQIHATGAGQKFLILFPWQVSSHKPVSGWLLRVTYIYFKWIASIQEEDFYFVIIQLFMYRLVPF